MEIAQEENITEELEHNGALRLHREHQVRIFLLSLQSPHNNSIIKQSTSINSPCGMALLTMYKNLLLIKIRKCFEQ